MPTTGSRVSVSRIGILLVLAIVGSVIAAPAGSASASGYVHDPPAVLGVSVTNQGTPSKALAVLGLLETQVGRMFAGYRVNADITKPVPWLVEDAFFDHGVTYGYRNAQANYAQEIGTVKKKVPICFGDIASGAWDGRLAEIATSLQADARFSHETPYLLSFHHEMSTNSTAQPSCGTPEDYKAAYRHVFAYFASLGLLWRDGGKLLLVWTPTQRMFTTGIAVAYDPDVDVDGSTVVGDYYDLVGVDVYDTVASRGHLRFSDPHGMFDSAHVYALSRGKQFVIGETGVSEDGLNDGVNEKALVLSTFVSVLSSYGTNEPGSLAAMFYTNDGKSVPTSSPEALAAFAQMAQDSYFGGSGLSPASP